MMMTFQELKNSYENKDEGFVEITDKEDALTQLNSRMSCCWGAGSKYGDSGWIKLCSPSKQSSGDLRTYLFVERIWCYNGWCQGICLFI